MGVEHILLVSSMTDHNLPSIPPNAFWPYVFPAVVASSTIIGFMVASESLGASESLRRLSMNVLAWGVLMIFVTHLAVERPKLDDLAKVATLLTLPALMMSTSPPWSVLWSTIVYTGIGVIAWLEATEENRAGWEVLRRALTTFWIVGGLLLSIADLSLFSHSRPVFFPEVALPLLDLRVIAGVIVCVLYCGAAMSATFRLDRPQIPDLPPLRIEAVASDSESALNAVVRPLSIVTVAATLVCWSILNLTWRMLAESFTHLSRFARALGRLLVNELITGEHLRIVFRGTLGLLAALLVSRFLNSVTPIFVEYVRSSPHNFAEGVAEMLAMGVWCAVLAALTIVGFHGFWSDDLFEADEIREYLTRGTYAAMMLLVAFAATGVVLLMVAKWPVTEIRGFETMGVFTKLMLFMIAIMAVYHAAQALLQRSKTVKRRRTSQSS